MLFIWFAIPTHQEVSYPLTQLSLVDMDNPEEVPSVTRVDFDITVPAYMSNELQIRLVWGDQDFTAGWVADESWSASMEVPTNTEHRLVVTFNDRNGDLTLGSFERNFRTGTSESESYRIAADQFDTDRWDDDSDGASNLNELMAGTDPLISNIVTFTMVQENVFNPRCDGCHDNTFPSGDLDLTEGNAYVNLVGQSSARKEGAILVIPFDPDNSYLVQKNGGGRRYCGKCDELWQPSFSRHGPRLDCPWSLGQLDWPTLRHTSLEYEDS